MSATDQCLQCGQVWGFPNHLVHYFQEQQNWRTSNRNLERQLKVTCVSRHMQPRTNGKTVLCTPISCLSCHILFSVLDKHKWCSNWSLPTLPLWPQHFSLCSLCCLSFYHITSCTCSLSSLSAHHALLVLNLTQNSEIAFLSSCWSA